MTTLSSPAVSSLTLAACTAVMMTFSRPLRGRRRSGMLSHVLLPITTAFTTRGEDSLVSSTSEDAVRSGTAVVSCWKCRRSPVS